jgi:hypothetical protein
MKITDPPDSDRYMTDHGYRALSQDERSVHGGLIERESIPSLISGWVKRSIYRAVNPRSDKPTVIYIRGFQPTDIRQVDIEPEYEPEPIDTFAGNPKLNFFVRSIDVNGHEFSSLGYFGVPDLMDNALFDGKCHVFGFPLSK